MDKKLKFAFYLAAGCAGCEMALVDLSEKLIDILDKFEVVFWAPTIADIKYKDLEAMPDKSIDVAFVDGAIRLSEQEHIVKVLREKAKILVAFGTCASVGGFIGVANLHSRDEIFEAVYVKTESSDNPDKVTPQTKCVVDGKYELTLPEFWDEVKPLHQVVEVDYFVGGCPPHREQIERIVEAIVSGNLPPKGSWITNGKAVCDVCPRNPAKKGERREFVKEVKRMVEGVPDEDKCLLQQGYICLGPVTQGDCNASCLKVNVPCRGCGGPLPGLTDFGARAISSLASILDDDAVEQLLKKYPTFTKLLYLYSLPTALINKKIKR